MPALCGTPMCLRISSAISATRTAVGATQAASTSGRMCASHTSRSASSAQRQRDGMLDGRKQSQRQNRQAFNSRSARLVMLTEASGFFCQSSVPSATKSARAGR